MWGQVWNLGARLSRVGNPSARTSRVCGIGLEYHGPCAGALRGLESVYRHEETEACKNRMGFGRSGGSIFGIFSPIAQSIFESHTAIMKKAEMDDILLDSGRKSAGSLGKARTGIGDGRHNENAHK